MGATSKEDAALRVGYDILYIGRIEVLKDRHNYSTIGYRSNVCYTPLDVIAANKGNLLTRFNTHLLEEDMQMSNLLGHLKVCQRLLAEIICQNWQGVILAETLLIHLNNILL